MTDRLEFIITKNGVPYAKTRTLPDSTAAMLEAFLALIELFEDIRMDESYETEADKYPFALSGRTRMD